MRPGGAVGPAQSRYHANLPSQGQGKFRVSQLLPARPQVAIERAPARLSAALFDRLDALLLFAPRDAAAALGALPHGALLARAHARRPRAALSCHLVPVPTRRGLAVIIGVLPDRADAFQRM